MALPSSAVQALAATGNFMDMGMYPELLIETDSVTSFPYWDSTGLHTFMSIRVVRFKFKF